MASLQTPGKSKQAHVDLTPMVDLNFLLITFFMFTTTMTKPKALQLQMPFKPSAETSAFYQSSAITLIPAGNHRVFYYEGLQQNISKLKATYFTGKNNLRSILQQKQKEIAQLPNPEHRNLQVLIKPTEASTFTDLVATLDEMKILGVVTFAVTDISPEEVALTY